MLPIKFALATTFRVGPVTFKAGAYEVTRVERWSCGEVVAWVAPTGPQGGTLQEIEIFRPEGYPSPFGEAMGRQALRLLLAEIDPQLSVGNLTSQNSTP